eukprot:scaffold2943_cov239-Pinguiococcus_pyrenoidosus.AAC.4
MAWSFHGILKMLLFGCLSTALDAQPPVARKVTRVIECPGGSFTRTSTRQVQPGESDSREEVYIFELATAQEVQFKVRGHRNSVALRVYTVAPGAYDDASRLVELDPTFEVHPTMDTDPVAFISYALPIGEYALVVAQEDGVGGKRSYKLRVKSLGRCSEKSVEVSAETKQVVAQRRLSSGVFDPAVDDLEAAVDAWTSNPSNAEDVYGHISTWNTSGITSMKRLFYFDTSFNDDISAWDTSSVIDMSGMFRSAGAFNQNLSAWDTSSVRDMSEMFYGANDFNGDISGWDTGSVTDMSEMFSNAKEFNRSIGKWNTGSVTDMSNMFRYAGKFNQDIGAWEVSSVTDMSYMFFAAGTFDQDIGAWDTSSVADMSY